MKKTKALVALLFILASTLATPSLLAQQSSSMHLTFADKLNTTVDEFDAAGMSMAKAAVNLAYEYNIPMAIEYVSRDAGRKPLDLKLRGKSLREVYVAVVASLPDYRVDFTQGLVDIYSPPARRDSSNPLNTIIRRYDADSLDTHFADAQLLCDLGRQLSPHSGCGGSVAGGQWGSKKITLHLQNKPVYEILNAIVSQNGQAVWVPLQQTETASPFLRNFWYIYPLESSFEGMVIQQIEKKQKDQQSKSPPRKPCCTK